MVTKSKTRRMSRAERQRERYADRGASMLAALLVAAQDLRQFRSHDNATLRTIESAIEYAATPGEIRRVRDWIDANDDFTRSGA